MLQLRPFDIATSYHDPPLEKVLESLKAIGSARFETGIRRKDGTVVPVEIHDRPLTRDGRKMTIAVVRDITEIKLNMNAIRIANQKLNLLSSITKHDINNQLMALQGYLTLLQTKHPEIDRDDLLHKAENSAERISAMIQITKTYEDIGVQSPIWQDVRKLVEKCANDVNLGKIRLENDIPRSTEVFATLLWSRYFVILSITRRHMVATSDTSVSLWKKNWVIVQ
jgi:signal transduction histidine kinase